MKIFSADKFKEVEGKNFLKFKLVKEWAKCCDGQPVENGYVIGTDGNKYFSDNKWEIESEEQPC